MQTKENHGEKVVCLPRNPLFFYLSVTPSSVLCLFDKKTAGRVNHVG